MRRHRILALIICVGAFSLVSVLAQSRVGHIRGTLTDAAGAPLPGVTVTIVGAGGLRRSAVSGATGEFAFPNLAPGRYSLTAALAGFKTATASIEVTAGATVKVAVPMTVQRASEHITVTGETPAAAAGPLRLKQGVVEGGVVGGVAGGVVGAVGTVLGLTADGAAHRRGIAGFNTEAYDKIDDNQWTEVARKPLSTFSIDVDTASYSNVRRFLNQGQLPPKDAVRLEELINYFTYDYPEPRDGKPFAVTTALGACPWNARHRLALVGLQARRLDSTHTPPRNLVFLIDVSGSMMTPQKLPLVKASLAMLAPNLTAKDRVAIVVYAGAAGLVLPATAGSDTQTIVEALGRLQAGGSTNGAQGLQLAYRVAQEHFIAGGVNRVILASDGDFNVGLTSQGDLVRLVEEQRDRGVALSVLGFGMGNTKDSTMEKLADKGNGNYAYIDSLAEAQKVLVEQAGGTLVTVAKDVKLQIEFNPAAVGAYRLIGYENRILRDEDFNNDRKDAGEMGAGHSVTALYELLPPGEPLDGPGTDPLKYQSPPRPSAAATPGEVMTVKVRYKQPDGDASSLLSVPVANRPVASPELGFAAAVAEFGMLLRDSEFKGTSTFGEAAAMAEKFKGADRYGHRSEFVRLIGAAGGITRLESPPIGRTEPR